MHTVLGTEPIAATAVRIIAAPSEVPDLLRRQVLL
jgi:hypothetical protein